MIIFLTGLATVTALVSCDVLRVLNPDKALPRAVVIVTAALLAIVGVAAVVQFVHLAQLA
ncbi:hypothetical protein SAMN04487916_106156 [Arthrobacter sp. ov407]|uniref:hypothetical protein n=1 Tax=Arthrobacter sp. ov407 TaxID=1761748 RepID=UPI00088052AC|nr:hypothetical protein [Arthrobacter sp. ov407]SDL16759.1 hypothetical protein SAMN04487916_106156 [Arthrobacter sp. ov407]